MRKRGKSSIIEMLPVTNMIAGKAGVKRFEDYEVSSLLFVLMMIFFLQKFISVKDSEESL